MRTTCLFLAATMTALGAAPAAEQNPDHRDPPAVATLKSDRIEMPMNTFGGRPLVPVTINGSGPYDFILDTGASLTLIDNELAKELKLPDLGASEVGSPAGGTVPTMITRFERLEVGGAVITASPGEAMDLAGFFAMEGAPRGVMSASHFRGLLLTFDYPGERIVLRKGSLSEPNGRDVLAYEAKGGHIWVPITVAGRAMQAHLDTGSPSLLMMPLELAKDLAFESEPVVVGNAKLVGKEMEIRAATLDGSVQIGPKSFDRPRVTLMDGPKVANIGRGALEGFAVTIDQKNQRIELAETGSWSEKAGGPQRVMVGGSSGQKVIMESGGPQRMVKSGSPGNKRYGIRFSGIDGEVLEVQGVDTGSPAEQAGLVAGDRIVEMNGRPTASLSVDDRIGALRGTPVRVVVERQGEKLELAMDLD